MKDIGIIGTGSYLPEQRVSNVEVALAADVTPEWIQERTGIVERRRAAPEQATSDLAAAAARHAIESAGLDPAQIDVVVVATSTPDHPQPATANLVQQLVGADRAAAVDVNAVCSGFVYALAMAHGLLSARYRDGYAVVIGADIYSRILDHSDRKTSILFGDGAGAVVLGPVGPGLGIRATHLSGHGDESQLIRVEAGGSRLPSSSSTVEQGRHFFRMDGRGVRRFVRDHLPSAVADLLAECEVSPSAVDHLVPHQANGQMLQEIYPLLGLPAAELHLTVDTCANTGAGSIPITLDAANRAGRLRPGDLVMLAGFGGGMNLGVSLCVWSEAAADAAQVHLRTGQEERRLAAFDPQNSSHSARASATAAPRTCP